MAASPSSPPVVAAVVTMAVTYALVILASLTLPVVAPMAAESLDVPAHMIGLYASLVYVGATLSSLAAPDLIARYGALRTSQGTLVIAALGLLSLLGGSVPACVVSAVLIGFAYGPGNTASGRLLSAMTSEGKRSGVFSIKQTSVPAGGALCGLVVPPLALAFGWQGAALAMALVCLGVAVAVEPWRARLDADRDRSHTLLPRISLAPVALVLAGPRLRALGLTGLVYSGMQYAYGAVLVVFLVERAGISAIDAGLILSAAMVASVVARVFWGYVADRARPEIVLGGLGVVTAGAVSASALVDAGWSRAALFALGCWFGASGFSWNGVYLALTADIAGPERVTAATSGIMTLVFLGSLAFPALYTALIAWSGYNAGLLTLAAVNGVTGVYIYLKLRQPASSPGSR